MNMTRFRELIRRDGWLYAAIALCVVLEKAHLMSKLRGGLLHA